MESLYNKHNFTIAKIAAKEESRHTLQAILVDKDRTVCTDGHRLLEVTTPAFDRKDFPTVPGVQVAQNGERFLFPADAALEVAKQIPRKVTIPVLGNAAPLEPVKADENGHRTVGFVTTDLEQAKPVMVREPDGMFPNYQAVIPPADKKPVLKIGFNARYLKELAAWFEGFTDEHKANGVSLTFYSDSQPVVIEAENDQGQHARALLMPIRL